MISPDLLERINKNRARYEKQGAIIEKYYNSFLTGKSNQKRGASFKNTSGSEGTDEPALLISNFAANKMPILYVGDMNLLVITIINTTSEIIFIRKPEALNYDTAPLVVEFNPGLLSEVEMNGIKLIDKEGVEQLKNDFPNLPIKASADDWGLTHSIEDEQYYSYLSPKKDIELAADSTIDIYSTAFELKDTGIQGIDNQIVTVKARYFGDIESKVQKETKFQVPFNIQGQDIEDKKSIEEFLTYGFKKNDKNLSSAPHVFVSDLKAEHKIENEFNLYFRNRDTEKTFVYPQEGSKADNHFGISFPCGTGPGCLGLLDEVNSIEITSKIYSESYKWNVEKNTNLPIPIWNLEPLNKVVFPTSNYSGDAPSVEFPIVKITSTSNSGTTLMYINCKVEGYADTTLVLEITKGIPKEPKINYFKESTLNREENINFQFGEEIKLSWQGFGAIGWTLNQSNNNNVISQYILESKPGSQIQSPKDFKLCLESLADQEDKQWVFDLKGNNSHGIFKTNQLIFKIMHPEAEFNVSQNEVIFGLPIIFSWEIVSGINWELVGPEGTTQIVGTTGEMTIIPPQELGIFTYTLQCYAMLHYVNGEENFKVYEMEPVSVTVVSPDIDAVYYPGPNCFYQQFFKKEYSIFDYDGGMGAFNWYSGSHLFEDSSDHCKKSYVPGVLKSFVLFDGIYNKGLTGQELLSSKMVPFLRRTAPVMYQGTEGLSFFNADEKISISKPDGSTIKSCIRSIEGEQPYMWQPTVFKTYNTYTDFLWGSWTEDSLEKKHQSTCIGMWPTFKVTQALVDSFQKVIESNQLENLEDFKLYGLTESSYKIFNGNNFEEQLTGFDSINRFVRSKMLCHLFVSQESLIEKLRTTLNPLQLNKEQSEAFLKIYDDYILTCTPTTLEIRYKCDVFKDVLNTLKGLKNLSLGCNVSDIFKEEEKDTDEYLHCLLAIKQFSIDNSKLLLGSISLQYTPNSNVYKSKMNHPKGTYSGKIFNHGDSILPSTSLINIDNESTEMLFNTNKGIHRISELDEIEFIVEGNILGLIVASPWNLVSIEAKDFYWKDIYWIEGDHKILRRAKYFYNYQGLKSSEVIREVEDLCEIDITGESVGFCLGQFKTEGESNNTLSSENNIYWIEYTDSLKKLIRWNVNKKQKEIVLGLKDEMEGNGLFVVESHNFVEESNEK